MPTPPTEPPSSGGFQVGDVDGNLNVTVGRDWVGRDKIVNITKTTTIQISVEAVTQKPLLTTSPYRGLDRFEDRDKDLFFGRDQLIQSLLAQINGTNIILVLGASGSGKSSVVRAGVLPRLSGELGAGFRYFTLVPDVNPFESLRSALQVGGFSQAQTCELLDAQPDAPTRLIRGLQREGHQWLIFIDQFEEIFTVSDERLRESFISALVKIAQDPTGSIKLLLAMRADFFDRFSPFPQFAKLIEKNIAFLTDMQVDELRLAIEQPAAKHGVVFEQGLVEEIIKDVQGQAGSLPLLQYTLSLCWQEEARSDGLADRHLNTQTYRQLGGVRGALQKRADEIYASFGDGADAKTESASQKVVRQIFLRVVDLAGQGVDEGAWRPVRRRVPKATFSSPQEQKILQALIDQKLLVSSGRQGAEATVEVAHEALFTSWGRLKGWIAGGKQVIFARNRLADDARRWHSRRNEDEAGVEEELLSGSRLGQALEMRARGDFDTLFGGLSETETQYLDTSAALRDRRAQEEQERQQRELAQAQALASEQKKRADDQAKAAARQAKAATRQRWLTMAMVLVSLVMIAAAGFSLRQRNEARAATSRANVSLARYSKEIGKNAQALAQLAKALRLNPENREASGLTAAMLTQISWHVPLTGSMRPHGEINSVQFSPDGQRVVTTSSDKTTQVWDAASGKPVGEPMKHEDVINSVQFSPDSQRVVSTSKDKMQVWDAASGKPIGEPMKHENVVLSVQFSPDSQRVVSDSKDRDIRRLFPPGKMQVWDAASGKPIGEPMKYEALGVASVQFSPNGQRVVTVSGDTTQMWDPTSGKPIGEPMKHDTYVGSAQFSPDGQRIVTASLDNTARLWDAANGKSIGEPMEHQGQVYSAQFSPDGQRVVTASSENTARLWDADSGKSIGEPMKHKTNVYSAQFSPDGQRIVTASEDKTAQVWDAASGKPIGEPVTHENAVISAQFSPDGQRIVTASKDETTEVWDAVSGKPIGEPLEHQNMVTSVWFSPNGQRIVTVSAHNTARFWDAASGKSIGEPMKYEGGVELVQFSPDGQRVVTTSGDTVQLWDAASGKSIGEPIKHEGKIASAQSSPNGQRIVTVSADKTARLWDAASGKPVGEPMKHEGMVRSPRFSPDGQRVVTASGDTMQMWDTTSGKPIGEPMKHEWGVVAVEFSPNGQWIVTVMGSIDLTARLWDAASGKPVGEPMKHQNVVVSAKFSPDGQRIGTTSADGTAHLWDTASGKPIGEPLEHRNFTVSVPFSPNGQRVVTVSGDTAQLWDTTTGKRIGEPMKHENRVFAAEFSPDGQWVLTGSEGGTARLWSATSSEPVGEPMREVGEAHFTPDSQRVLTFSRDRIRVWDAVIVTDKDTREDILLLAELAKATGGVTLETVGQSEKLKLLAPEQIRASREKIAAKFSRPSSKMTPLQRFLKWSVSDRRSRTISPFSQITVSEWLENSIKEETVEGLRAALQVDPTNARVTAHLGRALAEQALEQKGRDPDESRRARGEADFLTSRAVKLAPDNDEVKKLRDEVIKLLELKTN